MKYAKWVLASTLLVVAVVGIAASRGASVDQIRLTLGEAPSACSYELAGKTTDLEVFAQKLAQARLSPAELRGAERDAGFARALAACVASRSDLGATNITHSLQSALSRSETRPTLLCGVVECSYKLGELAAGDLEVPVIENGVTQRVSVGLTTLLFSESAGRVTIARTSAERAVIVIQVRDRTTAIAGARVSLIGLTKGAGKLGSDDCNFEETPTRARLIKTGGTGPESRCLTATTNDVGEARFWHSAPLEALLLRVSAEEYQSTSKRLGEPVPTTIVAELLRPKVSDCGDADALKKKLAAFIPQDSGETLKVRVDQDGYVRAASELPAVFARRLVHYQVPVFTPCRPTEFILRGT